MLAALATRLGGRRRTWALPLLDEWCARHVDPESGVWALTPPCGYGFWSLWAPGSADPDADFPYEDRCPHAGQPYALHPARQGENGEDGLPEIRGWLVPWLVEVTGGRVVDLVEGWSAPYGPERTSREYVIYAVVTS